MSQRKARNAPGLTGVVAHKNQSNKLLHVRLNRLLERDLYQIAVRIVVKCGEMGREYTLDFRDFKPIIFTSV